MRVLGMLLLACAMMCVGVIAKPGDNHAREHQNTPLWINIPVAPSDLDGLLANTGLTADVYTDGNAYVQILNYNLDKLETWIAGNWVDVTFQPGWVMKLNLLVQGPKGPGYMITNIDFQKDSIADWFSGLVRTLGAVFDQKIPSHACAMQPSPPSSSLTTGTSSAAMQCSFSYVQWDKIFTSQFIVSINDGFQGTATFNKKTTNGISSDDFVKWAVVRNNKYEKQNDGTIVWADVTYAGISAGLDTWYPLTTTSDNAWSVKMLQTRLGLTKNYPICSLTDKTYCFWGSYYGLIDHENTVIKAANANDIAVDGAVSAPSATTSTTSNNMIWLYGILVGVGASMLVMLSVYGIMVYRARGQQVLKATQAHATSVEMP